MAALCVSPRVLLETLKCGEFKLSVAKKIPNGVSFMSCGKWNLETFSSTHRLHSTRPIRHQCLSSSQSAHYHLQRSYCCKSQYSQPKTACTAKLWSHFGVLSISSPILSSCRQCHTVHTGRQYSTSQEDDQNYSAPSVDPLEIVSPEMSSFAQDICKELVTEEPQLKTMSHYYFDGKGKSFRPLVTLLMSKACNIHNNIGDRIMESQKIVAKVAEMIHTASLVHDDVIDASETRRGRSSLNKLYGQRQSILVGDYILSQASIALARTCNPQVISILSTVLEDLVSGEFMQLGSKEDENERFTHYLKKTYKKTASLIANTCKAVAVLAQCDEDMSEMAFQYGRNLGIAFQLIDDLLDFVASESVMGKPTAADLKLGLATAPVLFAAQEHSELHPLIMRRFSEDGDVELARSLVAKSDGVQQTKLLATRHSTEAIKNLQDFVQSDAQRALIRLAKILLDRKN